MRFAPSGWLVGYVQIVERGTANDRSNYLSSIRHPLTVTFLTRAGRWRRAAEEIAGRAEATLEMTSAAPYWSKLLGATRPRRD